MCQRKLNSGSTTFQTFYVKNFIDAIQRSFPEFELTSNGITGQPAVNLHLVGFN